MWRAKPRSSAPHNNHSQPLFYLAIASLVVSVNLVADGIREVYER